MRTFLTIFSVWLALAFPAFANGPGNMLLLGVGSPAVATYAGLGDTVSGWTVFYGLTAYNGAQAAAGTQKLIDAENPTTTEKCGVLVASTGGLGLTTGCTGSSNGQTLAVFCAQSGNTNCALGKWYDLSGANYCSAAACDLAVSTGTVANWATLYLSCPVGNAALPCVKGNVNSQYNTPGNVTPATSVDSFEAIAYTSVNSDGNPSFLMFANGNNKVGVTGVTNEWEVKGNTGGDLEAVATNLSFHIETGDCNGQAAQIWIESNGNAGSSNGPGTGVTCSTTAGQIVGFAGGSSNTTYYIEGGVMQGTALSLTQMASICVNRKAYWATPTACSSYTNGPGDAAQFSDWYGLRAYNAANAAAGTLAVNIRRASDNEKCDFGVTGTGALGVASNCTGADNGASLTTFLNATTGFATALYDQTGNGRTMSQSTNANQPQVILSCINSLPCLQFTSSSMTFGGGFFNPSNGTVGLEAVGENVSGSNFFGAILQNGASGNTLAWDATWEITGSSGSVTASASTGAAHVGVGVINGASSALYIDGSSTTGTVTGSSTAGQQEFINGAASSTNYWVESGYADKGTWDTSVDTLLCHGARLYYALGGSC